MTERHTLSNSERFESLYHASRTHLFRYAFRLTRDFSEAEDLLQAAMIKAWCHFESYDEGRSFLHWSMAIVKTTFLDGRRARKRRIQAVSLVAISEINGDKYAADVPDRSSSLEDMIFENSNREELHRAMSKLSNIHRRIVFLYDLLGLDYHECAEAEGIALGTVRSRLYRARGHLRNLLYDSTLAQHA